MRIRKILMEIVRDTSHIISCPRYEAQLRRQGLDPETKVRIHSLNPATCSGNDYVEVTDWQDAWREIKQRFGPAVNQIYDAESFRAEFDATVDRDGEGNQPPASEIIAVDPIELCKIKGVHEALAERLFKSGFTSIGHVAAASLDDLEAIQGIGPASAVTIRDGARVCGGEMSDPSPDTIDDADESDGVDSINPLAAFSPAEE